MAAGGTPPIRRRRSNRAIGLAGALAMLLPGPAAQAYELVSVETTRDGAAYVLRIEAVFAAPPARVLAVLTDYDHIHELHPRITQSRSLGIVGPATEEVYTRFEGCLLMFCRSLDRVERIRADDNALFAEDVPGRGSFREGSTVWRFVAAGEQARLKYEARFVPAFWVPPLIGPGQMSRSVQQMTLELMSEVERRAGRADD
jgi:hypothetical protein